jgi:hypothetical protein
MIQMIVILIVLGFCLYLVETYIPLSPPVQMLIRAVVILFSILYILSMFGIINIPVNLR